MHRAPYSQSMSPDDRDKTCALPYNQPTADNDGVRTGDSRHLNTAVNFKYSSVVTHAPEQLQYYCTPGTDNSTSSSVFHIA